MLFLWVPFGARHSPTAPHPRLMGSLLTIRYTTLHRTTLRCMLLSTFYKQCTGLLQYIECTRLLCPRLLELCCDNTLELRIAEVCCSIYAQPDCYLSRWPFAVYVRPLCLEHEYTENIVVISLNSDLIAFVVYPSLGAVLSSVQHLLL